MENSNSQELATESFSYSWLTDRKPFSSENSNEKEQNFNFDVPFTPSRFALVHADEIFFDGQIMPVYVDRAKVEALKRSESSVPQSPIRLGSSFVAKKSQCGKWRRSSKRILMKCFGFVKPLCKSIGRSRKSTSRVDDLERKVFEIRSWGNSVEASPRRPSSVYSVVDWCDVKKMSDFYYGLEKSKSWSSTTQASPQISPSRSTNSWCDLEGSIHEAILYCKRSIEK